ncbi:hypothetical protein PR202_gb23757 [Eleusine coracana subsp. coracana]|uniref:GTD-binding domain-containing protein n=1 Tax=Eleusine coracana subsp. coracana TaxID=191504 RepID=A0AAV5FJK7_ELECO|nr:hypothetical protein QOZ80_5BG0438220 [Eleusine coracana subsp. coracana]GJN35030.1 hypothetical protein PR202_gb23757 [Eleusine coracana subsp. coracana]
MVREFLVLAARAAVQWVLASLLLANGAAFCVIAAISERLRLGPPCILCARIHRLLCSSAIGGEGRDALRLLLCDAHLAAVADTGPGCSSKESKEGLDVDDRDKRSGPDTHRVVSIGSEICEQDHDTNGSSDAGRAGGNEEGTNSPLVSLFELAPIAAHPRDDVEHYLHKATPELPHNVEGGERLTVGQLLSLRAQRRELDALRADLESERRARAVAEEQRRQVEEQGELDREAARLAMELVHETEREKRILQQQLDACRAYQTQLCGDSVHHACEEEERGGGENNNYQSLVDFMPGTVYSSSPDLANLLKLYDESAGGSNGERRQREGYTPVVTVVAEEGEDEDDVAVGITGAGTEHSVNVDGSAATVGDYLHERNTSIQGETVNESA